MKSSVVAGAIVLWDAQFDLFAKRYRVIRVLIGVSFLSGLLLRVRF